jgi:hypothetical protein
MRRPLARASLLVAGAIVVLGTASGCSSDGDGDGAAATTTGAPASTTTTAAQVTDEEIIANINEKLRPALVEAFDGETAECVIGVLEDAGTGELDADAVVGAYEARCEVTATRVTGVITGATLVEQGATPEQGLCIADAIGSLTYDEVAAMDEDSTNALYEDCGIDVDELMAGTGG